jgi:hypothetical protein
MVVSFLAATSIQEFDSISGLLQRVAIAAGWLWITLFAASLLQQSTDAR